MAAHCLTKNFTEYSGFATPSRVSSQGRTRIALMSERKDNFSVTLTEGAPCKRKLYFHNYEDDGRNTLTTATAKRIKECLGVPALSPSLKESDIRPGSELFNKKTEEGPLSVAGKHQFTAFAATLFCAWEAMIRMSRLKLRRFLLSQTAIRNFIATLAGFSFMKQH